MGSTDDPSVLARPSTRRWDGGEGVTPLVLVPPMFLGAGFAELLDGRLALAAGLTIGGLVLLRLAMAVKPRV